MIPVIATGVGFLVAGLVALIIGWRFWLLVGVIVSLVTWLIANHNAWRSVYDTYQPSLDLPKLPPVIDNNPSEEKKP